FPSTARRTPPPAAALTTASPTREQSSTSQFRRRLARRRRRRERRAGAPAEAETSPGRSRLATALTRLVELLWLGIFPRRARHGRHRRGDSALVCPDLHAALGIPRHHRGGDPDGHRRSRSRRPLLRRGRL